MDGYIYVVGIGPGKEDGITKEAERILNEADITSPKITFGQSLLPEFDGTDDMVKM